MTLKGHFEINWPLACHYDVLHPLYSALIQLHARINCATFLTSIVLSPSYCVIDSVLGGVHINRKRQRSPIVYTKDVCWAAMIKDRMFGNYTEVRQKSFFLLPSIQTDSDIAKKSRKFIPLSSSLSRYRKEVHAYAESLMCQSNHLLFFNTAVKWKRFGFQNCNFCHICG